MVINRKYEWKPVADEGEVDRMRKNLQSFAQTEFKLILETGSRAVSRGAKEFTTRIPGVEIAQGLLKAAMNSAAMAIPRQIEYLRGLARLLPSSIRPPDFVSEPESERFPESMIQEALPLEVVQAPLVSEEPSDSESPFVVESERNASPPDTPFDVESAEKQCEFEFYDSRVRQSTSYEAAIEVESEEQCESPAETTRFEPDPPRTRFVARRLASQGYREAALSIYERLIAQDPEDQTLRQEAEEIRNGQPVFDSAIELPKTLPSASYIGSMDEENRIDCLDSNQNELSINWTVAPEGVQRAQSVIGEPGELYLRIFEVYSDPDAIVHSTIIEHGPVPKSGSWTARELSIDSRRAVAIGLRVGERFASITHIALPEPSAVSD